MADRPDGSGVPAGTRPAPLSVTVGGAGSPPSTGTPQQDWRLDVREVDLFEVAIDSLGTPDTFRVHVVQSSVGDAAATVHLPVADLLGRRARLHRAMYDDARHAGPVDAVADPLVRELGQDLFAALLGATDVSGRYHAACAVADSQGRRLRVVLRLGDAALAALPWEAMYDASRGEYLCRARDLVRHVPVAAALPLSPVDWPLRILGVVAAPDDADRIDDQRERRHLEESLAEHVAAGRVELAWASAPNWAALQEHLLEQRWDILHFIGHGRFDPARGEGELALVDRHGGKEYVGASRWVDLLAAGRRSPRLVVLNSCDSATAGHHDLFSSTAAALVRGGVAAVVGMQFPISDQAAVEFVSGLYRAAAHGLGIDQAVSNGRRAVVGHCPGAEWASPVLYLRGQHAHLFPPSAPQPGPPPSGPATPAVQPAAAVPARAPRPAAWLSAWLAACRAAWRPGEWAARLRAGWRNLRAHLRRVRERVASRRPIVFVPSVVAAVAVMVTLVLLWPDQRASTPAQRRSSYVGVYSARHGASVLKLAYNRDGSMLATASLDGTIRRWDTATGEPIGEPVRNVRGAIVAVAISPRDGTIACAGYSGVIQLLDPANGHTRQVLDPQSTEHINELAFTPDGRMLASADSAGAVRLWPTADAAAGTFAAEPARTIKASSKAVGALAFTPDGAILVTGSSDQAARAWRVADGQQVGATMTHPGTVFDVAIGRSLATASADGAIRQWDLATGQQLEEPMVGHPDVAWGVAYSPDGALLASVSDGDRVHAAVAATGSPHSGAASPTGASGASTSSNLDRLREAVASRDAEQAQATQSYGGNGSILLWDAAAGDEVASPPAGDTVGWNAVAFHPDGTTVALAGVDGSVRVRPVGRPPTRTAPSALLGLELKATQVAVDGRTVPAVAVHAVTPGTPAADSGLVAGDAILQIGPRVASSPDAVIATVRVMPPGTRTTLLVVHDGDLRSVPVTLTWRSDTPSPT